MATHGAILSNTNDVPDHLHEGVAGDGGAISSTVADQSITSRKVDLTVSSVDVVTVETTTSTTFTDLATAGPAVTLTPGVTQDHLLIVSADLSNTGGGTVKCFVAPAIAGATATDSNSARADVGTSRSGVTTKGILATAQVSGAVHTSKYKVDSGTGTFAERRLIGVCI